MIGSWLIGVRGLSDSIDMIVFLRQNNLPDVAGTLQGLGNATEPGAEILVLYHAAYLRAVGEMAQISFPLFVGKLILSVLLVITSSMAMSGRPGSRIITFQAHLAYAALSAATFWLLRDARYAAIDVMRTVHPLLPKLLASEPPQTLDLFTNLLDKPVLLFFSRISMAIFGVGALLLGASTLMTTRTKTFFDAVAAATTEDTEDL